MCLSKLIYQYRGENTTTLYAAKQNLSQNGNNYPNPTTFSTINPTLSNSQINNQIQWKYHNIYNNQTKLAAFNISAANSTITPKQINTTINNASNGDGSGS